MKNALLLTCAVWLLCACGSKPASEIVTVKDFKELKSAIQQASPGTEIVMAEGIWKDAPIKFYGKGTADRPVTLRAETPGKVFVEGESFLHLGGEHLVVSGLYFRNGHTPSGSVFQYQISKDSIANHSRITNCVIDGFTQLNRWERDSWIAFYGKHNELDHCYIAGKSNDGATLMVYHKGNEHTNSYHKIYANYFGPRPRKGGPRAETIRFGGSETSMTPGRITVTNNYFEACNGEVEIISDKTRSNSFTNNIFYKCEGSLVMRHADYTTVDGNIFIGGDDSDFYGGIRVVNTGHWITNNYFYKIRGEEFRSPLAIMNGIPKSSLNRYKQVTDVVVAHNTWVDCKSPFQIGVGQNKASASVLPKSEIRSAPPIRTTIANNIIYNTQPDDSPVVNHDDMDGIKFKGNVIANGGESYAESEVLKSVDLDMKQVNEWLFVPTNQQEALSAVYAGYDFERIEQDLFGADRKDQNQVGAVVDLARAETFELDRSKYGPSWFTPNQKQGTPTVHNATAGNLSQVLAEAKDGDVVALSAAVYELAEPLKIDKELTLRAAGDSKPQIIYTGPAGTPAFELHPGGVVRLQDVAMSGQEGQLAFAPLAENMSSAYKLFVQNSEISGFDFVLKASKGSFADSITFTNTSIKDCKNGFVLAADEKGDYNAEMVTFEACAFENVSQNVVHFYRGGYDESTIGGFLTLRNNTFTRCGAKDASKVLIKTPGIINVHLLNNTFKNNPVELVALLWGAKNNLHQGNTVVSSGEIKVEEQRKLDLLY
ncbi:chondroitinase-B domain-containing protein [Marinoscillum furvescens]|uniref:Poly(Beta-D-mannuronate) lyase n=1 Tax=Marinoscillum furvescens DSM 4134 TaxID=1122208 RepID=A0A3D9KZ18_MARFU|nr:chondroitinase-B domain-containing protein [Marinoscillum furvescens]RED95292.1 poly(beta-D-mannuronate) lyase [Marinoscillum furvescens DSM 4134]